MDKCPNCNVYSMGYDFSNKRATCTHNGCNFKLDMTEEDYIITYADKSKHILLPSKIEEKIKEKR